MVKAAAPEVAIEEEEGGTEAGVASTEAEEGAAEGPGTTGAGARERVDVAASKEVGVLLVVTVVTAVPAY